MPHQPLNITAVAHLLNLPPTEVERMVKDREIPCERRGGRVVFQQGEIEAWASQRILRFNARRIREYHQQTASPAGPSQSVGELLAGLLPPDAIASALTAKTKASVLRDLAALADGTGRLNDRATLVASLEAREELCSTAVPGGLAFPHPRQREPYLLESSFIVVGRVLQPIHFGAPDGQPTDLFFLLCLDDEKLHLRTLARLCLLAQKTDLAARLRAADDAVALRESVLAAGRELLAEITQGRAS
jgi:PTS system nitrogen regulatory IIA component